MVLAKDREIDGELNAVYNNMQVLFAIKMVLYLYHRLDRGGDISLKP